MFFLVLAQMVIKWVVADDVVSESLSVSCSYHLEMFNHNCMQLNADAAILFRTAQWFSLCIQCIYVQYNYYYYCSSI